MTARGYLSIGDVLTLLREEFPDVTISKIRFLESQGLVEPERSPSGYRKFYDHDVERLRWVLRQQREHFLPLRVIRDRLEHDERDDQPARAVEPAHAGVGAPTLVAQSAVAVRAGQAGHDGPVVPEPRAPLTTSSSTGPGHAGHGSRRDVGSEPHAPRAEAPVPASGHSPGRPAEALPANGAARGSGPGEVTAGRSGAGARRAGAPGDPATAGRTPPTPAGSAVSSGSSRSREPAGTGAGNQPKPGPTAPDAGAEPGSSSSTWGPPQSSASPHPPGSGGASGEEHAAAPARVPGGSGASGSPPASPGRDTPPTGAPTGPQPGAVPTGASLTAAELCTASGLSQAELEGLERFGLLAPMVVAGISCFDEEALTVARLAAGFAQFGVEPRHLRLFRNAADRELGLVEQIITPLLRQRNPQARQRAMETATELERLGDGLRAALLRQDIRSKFGQGA